MRILLAAIAAFFMLTIPAIAQAVADSAPIAIPVSTVVEVPVGSWANTALGYLALSLGGVVVWGFRFLPPQLYAMAMTVRADQLMTKAGEFALNSVAEAVRGKVWTIDTRNDYLKALATYVLMHGASAVKAFIGTPADIAEKGFARIGPLQGPNDAPPVDPLPVAAKPDFERIGEQAQAAAIIKGMQSK
jgi:hypothetical protein